MIEFLRFTAVWLSLCLGILVLLQSIDRFIFKQVFSKTDLGTILLTLVSFSMPWCFGSYTLVYIIYSICIVFGINVTISW